MRDKSRTSLGSWLCCKIMDYGKDNMSNWPFPRKPQLDSNRIPPQAWFLVELKA